MASLQATLASAQLHAQRGNLHHALKLYKGLLNLVPKHPQVNADLGALLLLMSQPAQALPYLERAYEQDRGSTSIWLNLLIANHKTGCIASARELLSVAPNMGLEPDQILSLNKVINEPPLERQVALNELLNKGDVLGAEIAARLFLNDFPDHELGIKALEKIEQSRLTESKAT